MYFNHCAFVALFLLALPLGAQQPLPDVPTLLREVQAHQAQLVKTRENYTFVEKTVIVELDKNGGTKKTESEDNEVFYVNAHEMQRKIRKNGKELSASEQEKEKSRVAKEVEKAEKTPIDKTMNEDTISVGRMLQIMKYSAAHRELVDNRSTIVFDYTGDPHADTHGRAENASKKLAGTVWIDEQDRQVRKLTARFEGDFHMGFGLFTLTKGSSFAFDQKLVNGELWLPVDAHVHIVAKAIGFVGYRGEIQQDDSNYQRFHAEAEQQSAAGSAKPPSP